MSIALVTAEPILMYKKFYFLFKMMNSSITTTLQYKFKNEASQERTANDKPKMKVKRQIIIEIPRYQIKIPIELPQTLEDFHTSGWLLKTLRLEVAQIFYTRKLPMETVSTIVGLQTKENNFHLDYLLSLHDQLLSFLPEKIVLVPYFCTLNNPSSELLDPKLTLEDFDIISKIGEGGFAKVYLVQMKTNGRFYALKQLQKAQLSEDRIHTLLLRERNSMISIDCDQIVKLHFAFQTTKYCYFVLDFIPCGDLHQLRVKVSKFTEEQAKFYLVQILLAFQELHSKNIIYRDLKLENLLVDNDGYIKLCDFGMAKKVDNLNSLQRTVCGTAHFMSPEMIVRKGYDVRTDYFSLGTLIYELVTGSIPFNEKELERLWQQIVTKEPQYPSFLSKQAKIFISRLLHKDPTRRLGAKRGISEILEHEWLEGIDIEKIKNREMSAPFIMESLTMKMQRPQVKMEIEEVVIEAKKVKFVGDGAHALSSFSFQIEDPNRFSLNIPQKAKSLGYFLKYMSCQELDADQDEDGVNYDSSLEELQVYSMGLTLRLDTYQPIYRNINALTLKGTAQNRRLL